MRHDRDRVVLALNHLREEFLRRLQCLAIAQVPPASTGTTNVPPPGRIACAAIEVNLDLHGFEVTIAGGETGLRALEDSSFDLMIVDIFMPRSLHR